MMSFFESPILNSPYEYPSRHWELDESGQPTGQIVDQRRPVSLDTPIPKPKKRRRGQRELVFHQAARKLDDGGQQYNLTEIIDGVRYEVDQWRALTDPREWRVTPETARLLRHWRHHKFRGLRPFFCQIEAVETVIWLTEVAPSIGKKGRRFLDHLEAANEAANPGLARLALKLATGSGKTMVMAMLIAWQTVNAVRHPNSRRFTHGFLVVTPEITIRDRLRELRPYDRDSYYQSCELVPKDMLVDLGWAKIAITNFHAFKPRETMVVSKGGRVLLQGRGPELSSLETTGQMVQRVVPELMGMRNVLVLNDGAHHCYREKLGEDADGELKDEDRKDAEKNREAARLWISGLEAVSEKLGLNRVIDLSATPFFLSGSGYEEGTLFPWTMCDFSLMDAIECGIVKLPRVPVAGRAQRCQSYDLNDNGRLNVEYADVRCIPFDFTAEPVVGPSQKPSRVVQVHAVRPARDHHEIRFPRVAGYRVTLPDDRLSAKFDEDSTLELTPELVEPSITRNEGIIGQATDLDLAHTGDLRRSTLVNKLTKRLLETTWRDATHDPKRHLFGQLERITRQWLDTHLVCTGGTYPAQLEYSALADMACDRITRAIVARHQDECPVKAVLDRYNHAGSTADVHFAISKKFLWKTDPRLCHVNFAVCDSVWEAEFCRIVEAHPRVQAYVKNQGLGLEVPYRHGSQTGTYLPDFILLVGAGLSKGTGLNLIVEINGYRGENAKAKKSTMDTYWVPGVNNLGTCGNWAFAEFCDLHAMEAEFSTEVEAEFDIMMKRFPSPSEIEAAKWLAKMGGTMPDLEHIPRRRSELAE